MRNNTELKKLKKTYRVSFRDIAKVCGYSETTICHWVNNKRELSDEKFEKISAGIKKAYSIH